MIDNLRHRLILHAMQQCDHRRLTVRERKENWRVARWLVVAALCWATIMVVWS